MTTMELCTVRGISNLPSLRPNRLIQSQSLLLRKTKGFHLHKQTRVSFVTRAGLQYHNNSSSLRSSISDEVSTKPDGKTTVEEDAEPLDKEGNDYSQINEAPQNDINLLEFWENLNLKFDFEDPSSILVFGGGGAVTLWLLSVVVGAVDSIPVLPKVLELVGFGYTLWFTSRYLIFKKNRDELVAKVEQIKQQVLGSEDE